VQLSNRIWPIRVVGMVGELVFLMSRRQLKAMEEALVWTAAKSKEPLHVDRAKLTKAKYPFPDKKLSDSAFFESNNDNINLNNTFFGIK